MPEYDQSPDGSDLDSEPNHSPKITSVELGLSDSDSELEYATPEADRATGMAGIQHEKDVPSERTDKTHAEDKPPKQQKTKKVHFAGSAIPQKHKTNKKQEDGLPGTAGPRARNPEGTESGNKTQVQPEELRRALDRPIDYRKVDGAPADNIPSLLEYTTSKSTETTLEKVSRIYQRRPKATENPEAKIYHIATKWHTDRREVLVAEDPPAHAFKLGVPVVRGERLSLTHVRSVTGSSLDPSDTGPTGFPYTGTPQLKIVDLDESIKEVLKYLRYLNALLFEVSDSPEAVVYDLRHTHIWLNSAGRVRQIDLAFQNRPLAAFVLFNPVFRLPLHVVPQAHQTCTREQPVLPCIYVWSPWEPVEGPTAGRSVLVYGPLLKGKTIEQVSNILATSVIERRESRHELGHLVDRIRKGTVRESPEDAALREVLLLEAVSPAAAELIVQHPYPWGVATTTCWLPSKEVSDEVAAREVAIVDRKQILHDHHRSHIVQAVVEHIEKLTANTTALKGTENIFDFHVPSRQWAPSTPGDPSSLLQWKRNGGGYTINYYAILAEEAYEAIAKAGKQTVRVLAGVDDAGRHISTSITVEVGRWSAQGAGTKQRQAPRAARGREARGGRIDQIAEEVASQFINKVGSKADEVFQQAVATSKQPTPETKKLLKNINKQLERFNESKPVTLDELRDLHREQERNAGVRHTEITQEVRGFHKTYQETGGAMVDTLMALTDRLTGEGKQQAPDHPLHFTKKSPQTAEEDDQYRGIPYTGKKPDPKRSQPPPKRPATNTGGRAIDAEPPAKRRAQGGAQATAQEGAQSESPRSAPPLTRKRMRQRASRCKRSMAGGGSQDHAGTHPHNTTSKGLFEKKGRLNMFQMQHAHTLYENDPLPPLVVASMRETLKPGNTKEPHTTKALQLLRNLQSFCIPVCDGKHWRVVLAGPDKANDKLKLWIYDSLNGKTKATLHNTKRLTTEMTNWAEHLAGKLSRQVTVELMNVGNQSAQDHYSCGVWALMATKAWMHFQETCPEGHWPTHFNEAVSKWGPTNRAAVDAYRKSIQHSVKKRITAAEGQQQTPGGSQQMTGAREPTDDPNPNPQAEAQPPRTQEGGHRVHTKQQGLWKWLHRLTPMNQARDNEHTRGEQGTMETHSDEGGEETSDEPTAQWEKFEDVQQEALETSDPRKHQPPLTEPKKGEIGEDRLHMLTWNIAGQSDACLDLAEAVRKRHQNQLGLQVVVLTEVKHAHDSVMRKFRDLQYTAIGTKTEAKEAGSAAGQPVKGGVAILLSNPYGHAHNHHVVPARHLEGYLLHVVLHLPGEVMYHVLGIYNPPGAEEGKTRDKILKYTANLFRRTAEKPNEHVIVGGDLNASNTSTGKRVTKTDKQWKKLAEELNLHNVGPTVNTTLNWAENRNIDRWLAPKDKRAQYERGSTAHLTQHHTSDHEMVSLTTLRLDSIDTHEPYVDQDPHPGQVKLNTPLSKAHRETLQSVLLRTHDYARTAKLKDMIGIATRCREEGNKQVAHATIDRAGEAVLSILNRANNCALKDEELPTVITGRTSTHGATDLLMSKKDRKERDAAILKMRMHKKPKRQLRNPHTEHTTLRHLKEGETKGPTNRDNADTKEWVSWLTEEAKKERSTAHKVVKQHWKRAKQRHNDKTVREYWNNQKRYHKRIYAKAQETGHAPTANIQALQDREGNLTVGHKNIANALVDHMAHSAPYRMEHRSLPDLATPPWEDPAHKERLVKAPRPDPKGMDLTISRQGYSKAVHTLNNNKAPGPTRTPNEILKYMPEDFHDALHALMLEMWNSKHVPLTWKRGTFCFHHKKGDVTLQQNYRPIALLEGVFKLYTSQIANMLSTFCETQGILAQAQEGSREKRNTLRQLTRVTNAIEDANVSGRELHGLYVDFENAYGSVDHNKLLHTMQYLGIPDELTQVVRDVLGTQSHDTMSMYTRVGGETSHETVQVQRGLLQGDSMSPLLFIIYQEPLLRWLEVGEHGYQHKHAAEQERLGPLRTTAGAFVDDLLILCPTIFHMRAQLHKLETFSRWSELKINLTKSAITGIKNGVSIPEQLHRDLKTVGVDGELSHFKILKPGDTYKYLGVLLAFTGRWDKEKEAAKEEMNHRIQALLRSPLTPDQKEYSLHSAILGKFRYGLHLGLYTAGEIDNFNKVIGGATKNIQGLPRNGTPNIFTTQEKERFGLGMVPLQAVYAQAIWSGLLEAMHSEEDRGAVRGPAWRQINLRSRLRMSHVSRSTRGLIEYHCTTRKNCTDLDKLWGGHQTKHNTLRKLNALLRYNITPQGTEGMLEQLQTPVPKIMEQLKGATRRKSDKEMEGTTRKTKAGKMMEGDLPAPPDWQAMYTDQTAKLTVPKDTPTAINFTTCLKLFAHFPDLAFLTTRDGQHAISQVNVREQCTDATLSADRSAIAKGLAHLYPYLCEAQPRNIAKPGDFYDSLTNRRLKQQYRSMPGEGPLDPHTMRTNLPRLNPEQLRAKMTEWEAKLVPREEIHRQLSLHPLTRINETETTGQTWGAEQEVPQDFHENPQTKWIDEVDPMARKMEADSFDRGQTIDKPKEIVAMRTLLIDPTDPHSQVTQYRTQWRHPTGEDSYSWSTRETITDFLKLAKRRGQSATTFPTLARRLRARGSQVTHPRGLKEILAGRPHLGQAWPTLHAENLTLDPTETNPGQDIADNREHHCQLRMEGDLAHSYHRNGKYIGTLTKEKLLRLHERYTQAVGTTHHQTPHQRTLRTEMWEDHKIQVSTFEEEIGHLLIRYSSKEEKEERKKNLQNHWTFPAQMQRALQQAFGLNTELFASPLNVHHNTTNYYAKYDRDKVFGARGSAWTANWMKLGAYQFNPEYTPQDLKKALDFAIAATTTQDPVFGVGIYPTYEKTPYRKLYNAHAGHLVHELLEIPQGKFTFLPPDHWMGATHQQAKQCNWNLRVLIVANKAGWQAHCGDPDAAADCIRQALTTCPQSKVRTTTTAKQPAREANQHDKHEPNQKGCTPGTDCIIDTRPWQRYEFPEIKAKDMTDAVGRMCNTMPHIRNDLCPQCHNVQTEIETWWEDGNLHVEDGPAKWELLPGSRGGKWDIHPPTVQQVIEANTSHTRLRRQTDAQTLWDKVARSKIVRYPADFWPEHEPGVQGRRWKLMRDQTEDPRNLPPSDTPAQLTYPPPQRAHEATSYLYTDGSKREIETEEGGKEWASGAAVWDPRSGEGEAHMIRWEGEDQEVNRAELLAIQKAVTLPPPPSGEGLTICTDSANSIRQLENMRTKPHSMEHHRQRDLLYAILVNIEALVAAGHTVSILKVKAHTGIAGNEKADEAAKQACTTGTFTEAWDNNETIQVKPMVPDEDSGSRELQGKLAVQKYVTTLLREQQARGNSRLTAKTTELQGEPTTWTHQLKTKHIFRWEAHHDQAQQNEEEQAMMRDPKPNQQQQADQTRDEEGRQITTMMEQREDEEMLLIRDMHEQQDQRKTEGGTGPTRGSDPTPAETPPQPREREEVFEELNELVERLEATQKQHNDEETFEMLNELIEQREAPKGGPANERQAHHDRVTEESRVHAMMQDPMPRTRWKQRKHDMTHNRTKNRNAPPVQENKATDNWLNETMGHLKGDMPLHKIANGFWKRATFAARKTILKCRLRILPAQDYETAKNSAGGNGKCTLEGCRHKGVDYAKGFLMRVGHALGGCDNPQMRGMFSDRADAHADELKHILDHHRKGGCKVLAYTGKKRDPGVKPRVLPNYILTRGQCRHDGKNNPGRNDGPDTIPSFVDIVMIEGLEDLEDGWECTQQEAPARVKNLHLIEVAHTDDEKWGPKLLEKYTKYGPLLQLLRRHGFRAKLHVFAVGRTGTVYKHNRDILEQLGLDRKEAIQALQRIHDLTVNYAHSTYQLYRRLRQEKQEKEKDENHPLSSVRLVIIQALNLGLDVHHMDVETAFLNSTLGEDLYVRLPRGLEYQGRTCAKLLKTVYGLKQAGKEWFDTSDAFIMSYDKRMRRSNVEPCLYYIRDSDITVIILAYVDDYICATNSRSWYDNFVTTFNSQYTCKDLGVLDLVMGIGVRWGTGVAYLSPSGYISQMIDTYGLKDAKPASLPMSPGCSLAPSDGKDATIPFRGLLGRLQWIARCTRPDIMAAVSALSRFCASYGPEHFVALKQVVRYLKGTMSHELVLRTTSSVPRGLGLAGGALPLSIYTDADYAGCKTTRRSTSGIAVYLCGSLLIFSSIMQRCVSLSTTEAEIIAMSEGAREVKYIINVLTDLVDICTPVPMYCDNQGAIHLASDYVNNNRSKHIEVRNMYIKGLVKSKMVEAMYVASADNTADVFTKPLPLPAFLTHRERLGIMKLKNSDPED
ncbi:hypothetical protein CYMTET_50334 [Cymbomonas tetramitiformis]|uniref:Reverse transcriptase domain-containing protein n=1 Tax=Cymbomonas tetramitiformis TaxID=36881 RepID=A0AAE0ET82_9CHLO|nr:hypothetical protein CYMTET_50334 [Cymbomonas tetramitiformis]